MNVYCAAHLDTIERYLKSLMFCDVELRSRFGYGYVC